MVACTTTPKPITKNGRALIKTGIHLLWPGVYVRQDNAHALRSAIVFRLTQRFGQRDGSNNWMDVVDKCVYDMNGLRMLGSRKAHVCGKCHNDKGRNTCAECGGEGKIDEGRPYAPKMIFTGNGEPERVPSTHWMDEDHEDLMLELARSTSIRTNLETLGIERVPHLPDWFVRWVRSPPVDQDDEDMRPSDEACPGVIRRHNKPSNAPQFQRCGNDGVFHESDKLRILDPISNKVG